METGDLRGIVRPSEALRHFDLVRHRPDPGTGRFVDRFWRTSWDLTEPFTQRIVTYPVVNLVFQSDGSATVSGIQRRPDARRLEGTGWAFGVMFRPAGFEPLTDRPQAELTDRRFDAADVLGPEIRAVTDAVVAASGDRARIRAVTGFLAGRLPSEPTVGEELSALIERAATADPPITRVDELAAAHGVSPRTLQRLFHRHVGVGPKLVLRRYRVQAAAELALEEQSELAEVATRLGYADQAHLTTDLADQVGTPPGRYRRLEDGR